MNFTSNTKFVVKSRKNGVTIYKVPKDIMFMETYSRMFD